MLNPPTVLDPGHTTNRLGADQVIQFVREFGLKFILAAYELLKNLMVRSREVGAVSSRGVPGRFLCPNFEFCTRGDSVASQSHFSFPTVTGLTGLSGCESGFGFLPSPVKKPCTWQIVDVGENIVPEHIPPAVLLQQEKLEKMKKQKKIADPSKVFRRNRPNPIFRCGSS